MVYYLLIQWYKLPARGCRTRRLQKGTCQSFPEARRETPSGYNRYIRTVSDMAAALSVAF